MIIYLDHFSELNGGGNIKNPELADVNLEAISDDDLSKLFQSEEVILTFIQFINCSVFTNIQAKVRN